MFLRCNSNMKPLDKEQSQKNQCYIRKLHCSTLNGVISCILSLEKVTESTGESNIISIVDINAFSVAKNLLISEMNRKKND